MAEQRSATGPLARDSPQAASISTDGTRVRPATSTSSFRKGSQVRPVTSASSFKKIRPMTSTSSFHQLPDTSLMAGHDEEQAVRATETTHEEEEETKEGPAQPEPPRDPGAGFPDGGAKAWLCVFGSFFCLFVSFGWINAIGIFQEYYQENLLRDLSPSTVAWIPSLETFFMFIGGPINGKIYDNFGPRGLLLFGTFFHVFGLMMTSLSTKYYQFILAQGICSPIGASAIFFPAVSATSTWFFHKRALALGIVAAGSSLGGVIWPILVQNLIPIVGFPWTMRVCAFVILGLLVISNLTVASRLPPAKTPFNPRMLYACFTETPFVVLTIGAFLFFVAMFIPFNFLILQAQSVGVDAKLAAYLIPILNAVSILGRTLPGYLADKLGRMNVLIYCSLFAGIVTLAIWLPAQGKAPVVIFAVLFGFATGAFVGLIPAVIAQISPIKEIGIRNGNLFAALSIAALIGNPIAGALIAEDGERYSHLQIFAGVFLTVGALVIGLARASIKGVGFNLAKKI